MNRNDLTTKQGEQVYIEVREMLYRLYELKARMEMRGFAPDDSLYTATVTAWQALGEMKRQWHLVAIGLSSYSKLVIKPDKQPQPSGDERCGD